MCPLSVSDGHDFPWLRDKAAPCITAMIDNIFEGGRDAVGEPVIAHELPDVFNRVELRAPGRQGNQCYIIRDFECVCCMPAGLIRYNDSVCAFGDSLRDFWLGIPNSGRSHRHMCRWMMITLCACARTGTAQMAFFAAVLARTTP